MTNKKVSLSMESVDQSQDQLVERGRQLHDQAVYEAFTGLMSAGTGFFKKSDIRINEPESCA